MLLITILRITLAIVPAHALSEAERIAREDARLTFLEFEWATHELGTKALDSVAEYESNRYDLESRLRAYCDSMRRFPAIHRECEPKLKASAKLLDQRAKTLAATVKEDKYQQAMLKLEAFRMRQQELRGVQPDGKDIDADTLRQKRVELEKEISDYCSNAPREVFRKSCLRILDLTRVNLTQHERSLRSGAYETPPKKPGEPKKHTDRTPMLRCYAGLPLLPDPAATYTVSDPSGRYRYDRMAKIESGYMLNIKLNEFSAKDPNNQVAVTKRFSGPGGTTSYEYYINASYGCAPDGATPPNCSLSGISISLTSAPASGEPAFATAVFPIKHDAIFDLALPVHGSDFEQFRVTCAIAAKMRLGGWMFSDEALPD